MRLNKLSQKVNSWTRWHPWNPIFEPENQEDIDWLIELEQKAKPFVYDPSTVVGDIVHQRERTVKIEIVKYVCPECASLSSTRKDLRIHISKYHLFGRKEAEKLAVEAQEVTVVESLRDVDIFYEVIKPRKILELPAQVEVKIPLDINAAFEVQHPPTGRERERHDREMEQWRKDMQTKKRDDILQRFPNGLFYDPGLSGNWWYFVPHVWRQEADEGKGKWLEPTEQECLNWSKLTLPKRVLYLLAIIRNDEGAGIVEEEENESIQEEKEREEREEI